MGIGRELALSGCVRPLLADGELIPGRQGGYQGLRTESPGKVVARILLEYRTGLGIARKTSSEESARPSFRLHEPPRQVGGGTWTPAESCEKPGDRGGILLRRSRRRPPGDFASPHGPLDGGVGELNTARGGFPRPQVADSRFHRRAGRRDNGGRAKAAEAMMKREYVASPDDPHTADL